MIIVTTLVIPPGGDVGPFDLYSDSDGYTVPFATNISAAALQAGYSSTVPNDATIIRVISTGLCTNFIDLNINLITTTTTSSSSSTSTSTSSTTTTTTTICPCTYMNITITPGYIAFSDTGSVNVTYTNCQGLPDSITYTVSGAYIICSSNINSIEGHYTRFGVPLIVPVFPFNLGTLCCIPTTTTTSSTTAIPCNCVTFYNGLLTDQEITYIDCNGDLQSELIDPGATNSYCGCCGDAPNPAVIITEGGACILGVCPPTTTTTTTI